MVNSLGQYTDYLWAGHIVVLVVDPASDSGSKVFPYGAVIGGIVGALAILLLLVALCKWDPVHKRLPFDPFLLFHRNNDGISLHAFLQNPPLIIPLLIQCCMQVFLHVSVTPGTLGLQSLACSMKSRMILDDMSQYLRNQFS